jgi:hypothetical protein
VADKLITRWRKILKGRRQRRDRLNKLIPKLVSTIKKRVAKLSPVPSAPGGWHPHATRTQVQSPLSFIPGTKPKLVWHTTEGSSLPLYNGGWPHFTLNPKTGQLWQHVPLTGGCYTLRNLSGGIETNRAHAYQVELIGFARDTATWPSSYYKNIAKLARWIEKHGRVPRKCSVTFRSTSSVKVGDFYGYTGHIGHQHVPENDHWDPGELRIEEVL